MLPDDGRIPALPGGKIKKWGSRAGDVGLVLPGLSGPRHGGTFGHKTSMCEGLPLTKRRTVEEGGRGGRRHSGKGERVLKRKGAPANIFWAVKVGGRCKRQNPNRTNSNTGLERLVKKILQRARKFKRKEGGHGRSQQETSKNMKVVRRVGRESTGWTVRGGEGVTNMEWSQAAEAGVKERRKTSNHCEVT